jgi:cytochrome subunit of sulfide dehydrogenase
MQPIGMAVFRCCLVVLPCLFGSVCSAGNSAPDAAGLCVACHADDGAGVGKMVVPIISGMPSVHIEEALYAYKDGARDCVLLPQMCDTADSLSDENIADLADYYADMPRSSLDEPYSPAMAGSGREIHEALCDQCHVPPDDPDVADALGPPLHGQRSIYLRYALNSYLNGSRENLLPAMEEKILLLDDDDVEALVNYYVSY